MQSGVDVLVVGGGLAGVSCALGSARGGRRVLLVERRPVLGWESTWAGQLDYHDASTPTARMIVGLLGRAGGLRQNIADAAILEMVLDRVCREAGVEVLFYCHPVQIFVHGDVALGVALAGRSGEFLLRPGAIVDATEGALLWRQTAAEVAPCSPPLGRHSLFMNHAGSGLPLPLDLGAGVSISPSLWRGEVRVEYEVDEPTSLEARSKMAHAISRAREVPELSDALVTHAANEPFPLGPPIRFRDRSLAHPGIQNLFACGAWVGDRENTPSERLALGEQCAALVGAYEGGAHPAGELHMGLAIDRPDWSSQVLVVGGGTAGAIAAIASAREGVDTVLLEASTSLGGIGTAGLIHSYYYGLGGGLQDEVDARVAEVAPLYCGAWGSKGFHPEAKKQVLQEMAKEANVRICYDTTVMDVLLKGDHAPALASQRLALAPRDRDRRTHVVGVLACTSSGVATFQSDLVIDSTGDGDLATMAGASYAIGREKDQVCHTYSQPAAFLDRENGGLRYHNFDAGYVDPTDAADLTRARRSGIQLYWRDVFDEESRLLYMAPLLGVRQGRQILGEYVLTLADLVSGRRFDDAVSFTESHYDNHARDIESESDQAALWVWGLGNWKTTIGSEVPFRCLLPKGVDGLLLASRALSMTYDAHHAFRMQKDLQRMGEVAGLFAAYSVKQAIGVRHVDVPAMQPVLRERGLLDERYRPKPAIANSRPIQLTDPGAAPEDAMHLVWPSAGPGAEGVPALLDTLASGDSQTRFRASVALATRGHAEGVAALIRVVLERALEETGGQRAVPMWQAAIPFMGISGGPEAVPALVGVLRDTQASLDALIAAANSLGRIDDPRVLEALREVLRRGDLPAERVFGSPAGVNSAREDATWQLSLAVADALRRRGASTIEVRDILQPYLADPRAYVRRYAQKVLLDAGTRGAPRA